MPLNRTRTQHSRPKRQEALEIIGSPGRTPTGWSGNLVLLGGRIYYLTDVLFETLLAAIVASRGRIDGEFHRSEICALLNKSTDSMRHRLAALNKTMRGDKVEPPLIEMLGGLNCFNLHPDAISYDVERLQAHRLDVVRRLMDSLMKHPSGYVRRIPGASV